MEFFDCKNIQEFYKKTGMTRQEAFTFLIKELNKIKKEREVDKNESKHRVHSSC